MTFSVIVPTMGKPSLGDFIAHHKKFKGSIIDRIIVVDFDVKYSKNRNLYQELDKNDDLIVDVQKEKWFNKSLAINIGVSLLSVENFIICDADVLIQHEALETWMEIIETDQIVISLEYVLETLDLEKRPAPGICCLKRSNFLSVEGYCSDYIGWGFEDHDFLFRLQRHGVQVYSHGWGYHLTHDDNERTQNYYSQNKAEMRSRNLNFFEKRCSYPNSSGTFHSDIGSCDFSEISPTYFVVSR